MVSAILCLTILTDRLVPCNEEEDQCHAEVFDDPYMNRVGYGMYHLPQIFFNQSNSFFHEALILIGPLLVIC